MILIARTARKVQPEPFELHRNGIGKRQRSDPHEPGLADLSDLLEKVFEIHVACNDVSLVLRIEIGKNPVVGFAQNFGA